MGNGMPKNKSFSNGMSQGVTSKATLVKMIQEKRGKKDHSADKIKPNQHIYDSKRSNYLSSHPKQEPEDKENLNRLNGF